MYIKGIEFTIGADPEFFLQDKKTGRFIGAHGTTPGTKKKPEKFRDLGALQVDGMALEVNTKPVTTTIAFKLNLRLMLDAIPVRLSDRGFKNVSLEASPTADFDEEEWARAPEEAKILGCSPDFNAWTGNVNEVPDASVPFRSGAGHIHIGWGKGIKQTEDFKKVCAEFTKEMDAALGVASLLWDQDTRRRELYGRAGAFRPKPYGVEYRTLSNAWLRSYALMDYVASSTFSVVRRLMSGEKFSTEEVEAIINTNNTEEAMYFLIHNELPLPPERVV